MGPLASHSGPVAPAVWASEVSRTRVSCPLVFLNQGSLGSPGWPGTCSPPRAGAKRAATRPGSIWVLRQVLTTRVWLT